jgi:hypothetical protein
MQATQTWFLLTVTDENGNCPMLVAANMRQLTKRLSTHGVTTGQQLLRTPPAVFDIVHHAPGELHCGVLHRTFCKDLESVIGALDTLQSRPVPGVCVCVSREWFAAALFIMLSMTRQEEGKNRIKGTGSRL